MCVCVCEHASSQLLVQALVLSRLDYCNALLAGLPASSIKPLQLTQHVTPLFINLHWQPITARIKFKALMFAYKTSTGSVPLYLNSLLQTYVPLEACVLQVNVALLFIPKRHEITFTDFYINCSLLVTCPTQSSSWVLNHLQESAKNTSLPSLCNPLTLALSILITFFKKRVPFRLALYSFTACFLIKNSYFCILSICFLFIYYTINKSKKASNTSLLYSFSILSVFFLFII